LPYRQQNLEIRGDDESDILYFVSEIVPRHGEHIRGLKTLGQYWQLISKERKNTARARALLARAIPHLVGLTNLITHISRYDAHFDPTRDALAATAVRFGPQLTLLDISDMECMGHGSPSIKPLYLAQLLARLPNLEDLTLQDVVRGEKEDQDALYHAIRRLNRLRSLAFEHSDCFDGRLPLGSWTAPLQHLRINDCHQITLVDIEIFTRHFSASLESLDISDHLFKRSLALPFNLTSLTSLTLESSFPFMRLLCFSSSPVVTLGLSIPGETCCDREMVRSALEGCKPTLKTVRLLRKDHAWDDMVLGNIRGYCQGNGIECEVGGKPYPA
jgi:hypothetical protein